MNTTRDSVVSYQRETLANGQLELNVWSTLSIFCDKCSRSTQYFYLCLWPDHGPAHGTLMFTSVPNSLCKPKFLVHG